MALRKKLDDDDFALLEIFEDPIWLGSFLRTTSDGEIDKSLWSPNEWNYRDYQKQFLTDQSEFILYTGGRAIGKCSPSTSKVLVVGHGYKTLFEVAKSKSFTTYTLTPEMTIEQRRAVCVKDIQTDWYKVKTISGHEFVGTKNHPMLTPEGYKLIGDLTAGDVIGVATKLPHHSQKESLRWHELRFLGYILFFPHHRWSAEYPFQPKYKKIGKELEIIADRFLVHWHKDFNGYYKFPNRQGPWQHPMNALLRELGIFVAMKAWNRVISAIPDVLKEENLDNIRVFLEALFAQYGIIEPRSIRISAKHNNVLKDLRELLLRFGIESIVDEDKNELSLLDYRAYYRFWQEFDLPGIRIGDLPLPPASLDATEFMRFDKVISITPAGYGQTYAVHVYEHNNYIGDNCYVHNSIVLQDKIVHEILNADLEMPETKEALLVTPNKAQMTPILGQIITRFTSSRFLRYFLMNNINRAEGIMNFPYGHRPITFHFRIAGSRGENNMVMST